MGIMKKAFSIALALALVLINPCRLFSAVFLAPAGAEKSVIEHTLHLKHIDEVSNVVDLIILGDAGKLDEYLNEKSRASKKTEISQDAKWLIEQISRVLDEITSGANGKGESAAAYIEDNVPDCYKSFICQRVIKIALDDQTKPVFKKDSPGVYQLIEFIDGAVILGFRGDREDDGNDVLTAAGLLTTEWSGYETTKPADAEDPDVKKAKLIEDLTGLKDKIGVVKGKQLGDKGKGIKDNWKEWEETFNNLMTEFDSLNISYNTSSAPKPSYVDGWYDLRAVLGMGGLKAGQLNKSSIMNKYLNRFDTSINYFLKLLGAEDQATEAESLIRVFPDTAALGILAECL